MFYRMKIKKPTKLSTQTYICHEYDLSDAMVIFSKVDDLSISKKIPTYEEEKDSIVIDRISKDEFKALLHSSGVISL